MRGKNRRVDTYYARGLLEVRSSLHLSLRLILRANQVIQQSGAASEGSGIRRLAIVLFSALDLGIYVQLRRSGRFGLWWRLPLDAADAVFWVMSPLPASGNAEVAIFIAIPLAVEAGVRLGWRGLVVPVVILATTSVGAAAVDKPLPLVGFGWIVLAVAMGVCLLRYCRHLSELAGAEHERRLVAARRVAYLAGQNDVAMGASSAVDVMEGLVPVLGPPQAGSALWRLADGWKSQLSASTAREAQYLQVALLEWERAHNRHPDLSGLVEIAVAEGDGTTLLTAAQAYQLVQILDRLHLNATVIVRLHEPDATRLPGQALALVVNGVTVVVPPDRRAGARPIDPCAAAYVYVGALVAASMLPPGGSVPIPAALAGMATCAVAGAISHRRIRTHGERARLGVFVGAIAVATVPTLASSLVRSGLTADGDPILGFSSGLILLSFLGGFYWRSLARRRWIVPAAIGFQVMLGVIVFPLAAAVNARTLTTQVLYNLFPYLPCRHLARALRRVGAEHDRSLRIADDDAGRAAFLDGRATVVGLVRQAREDALLQLQRLGPTLDADLAKLASRRLQEVERRLTTVRP